MINRRNLCGLAAGLALSALTFGCATSREFEKDAMINPPVRIWHTSAVVEGVSQYDIDTYINTRTHKVMYAVTNNAPRVLTPAECFRENYKGDSSLIKL